MADLRVVDAEELPSGNIWFEFDRPVTAAFADDTAVMHEDRHKDTRETSQEWIIQMYDDDTVALGNGNTDSEIMVHPAEDKQLELTGDDHLRISTLLEGCSDPTIAFCVFTFSVVGVDQP